MIHRRSSGIEVARAGEDISLQISADGFTLQRHWLNQWCCFEKSHPKNPLQPDNKIPEASMERTLIQLFLDSVGRYAANPMMWEKNGSSYQPLTYQGAYDKVMSTAAGLMALGFAKGDRAVLFSEGRNDWVISELGALFAGGISVPVSVKINEADELRFRIHHSGARVVIVSGRHLDKILPLVKDLPHLKTIITLDAKTEERDDLMSMEHCRQLGRDYIRSHEDALRERWTSITESDAANICYTSGTTADPKGIVLTHRNYTANVEQSSAYYAIPQYYKSLLILPWDHSFAHTCGIYTLMANGASMAAVQVGKNLIETTRNISKNIKEVQPHFLLSVPALSDNFKRNIERGIASKGAVISALFRWGLKVAYAYHGDGYRDGSYQGNTGLAPLYNLFNKIVFSKIRLEFGGRLGFFVGGGALLDIEYQRFFSALGMPVYQGYGLSEAAPVISANHPERQKMGTSGPIVPNLELKIIDDQGMALPPGQKGEIVVRGDNVMAGYWQNPSATEEALQNGWLHTGDMGYMDEEGFLMVLGRFKSLLISNDGEKYSPEGIEEALLGLSSSVGQIMLHNNQHPYTAALIVPSKTALIAELKARGVSLNDETAWKRAMDIFIDAAAHPDLKAQVPGKWLPSALAILDEGFSEENRMINSTMKMVRHRIAEHHAERLAYCFTADGKDPYNEKNETALKRILGID